jgi:hypothetical protein
MRKRRVGTVLRAFACLRGPSRLCRIFFGDTPLDTRLYSGYTTILAPLGDYPVLDLCQ